MVSRSFAGRGVHAMHRGLDFSLWVSSLSSGHTLRYLIDHLKHTRVQAPAQSSSIRKSREVVVGG